MGVAIQTGVFSQETLLFDSLLAWYNAFFGCVFLPAPVPQVQVKSPVR